MLREGPPAWARPAAPKRSHRSAARRAVQSARPP